jgi:2-polyprenyl-3-methyl-5-hydroxy-6-metoxy-1,4-benzoquinol methylase
MSSNFPIDQLLALQHKPLPFTPGETLFWNDPYISNQMLAAHLDPETDAASRRPEHINHSVAWLVEMLGLQPGDRVLDLGCGPGLYAARLARLGLAVTGVDYSRRSIDYAIEYALMHGLNVNYRCQDYLTLAAQTQYDAVLLIYGDFCTFAPVQRAHLLHRVHQALQPGGRFALDVSTPEHRQRHRLQNGWYAAEKGFWRPGPHLVLEQGFDYPDELIYLDQYAVLELDGQLAVYRNWFQDYTPAMITAELRAASFVVEDLWGDLAGAPLQAGDEWIGVIARKV